MKSLLLILLAFGTFNCWPNSIDDSFTDSVASPDSIVLPAERNILPFALYSDETSLGTGFLFSYHFPSRSQFKVSNIRTSVTYTLKEQMMFEVSSEYFTLDDKYKFSGEIELSKFPNLFYGIGKDVTDDLKEEYTPYIFKFSGVVQQYLNSRLRVGLTCDLRYEKIKTYEPGKVLARGIISGSRPFWVSGVGIVAGDDSRDNIFMSRTGSLTEFSFSVYSSVFGSDYGYRLLKLDMRRFFSIAGERSLAFQIYLSTVFGEAPFQELPTLGGSRLMRGFLEDRYRDKFMGVAQSEFRYGIWKRFGGVVFLSAGDVASAFNDFSICEVKVAGGAGLRYRLNSNNTRLRIDYGVTNTGSSGIYFSVLEAF